MEPLIKITTDPIRIERFHQGGRLVSANNVDMERRKALARHAAFRQSVGQSLETMDGVTQINQAFSQNQVQTQVSDNTSAFQQKLVSTQPRPQPQPQAPAVASAPMPVANASSETASSASTSTISVSAVSSSQASASLDVAAIASSSYTAQRGAFEMRVARGDLTYFPPMVMTVVTQRPQVHIEYLGGFHYITPRNDFVGNLNLFT